MSDETSAAAPSIEPRARPERLICSISGAARPRKDLVAFETLRPSLSDRIRQDFPDLPPDALISRRELARYRQLYVEEVLKLEHGELTELEREVAESIAKADTLAENVEEEFAEKRTLGEVMADHVASFGGSWAFIIWFGTVMAGWMVLNLYVGAERAFDAYPFILLNLVLSTLAAIQAPIIMMSQKRQEAKDRLRSFNDYKVNLKAELEIRHLHEKMDYLITKQWQRLIDIQQLQLDLMQEKQAGKPPKRPLPPLS
jgi:uncharacterized membrane protein